MFSVLWGVAECTTTTAAKTKSCDFERGWESLPDRVRCHIQFSCRCADQVVSRRNYRGWLYLENAVFSGHCGSCPSLFLSNWAELWLECKCWRIILTQGNENGGGGVRGLLATSLGLIGGFWPEKGEHLWRGSAKLSMWQPHWWDQLFWVQRTVITSSPSVGCEFFFCLPSTYSPPFPPPFHPGCTDCVCCLASRLI